MAIHAEEYSLLVSEIEDLQDIRTRMFQIQLEQAAKIAGLEATLDASNQQRLWITDEKSRILKERNTARLMKNACTVGVIGGLIYLAAKNQ